MIKKLFLTATLALVALVASTGVAAAFTATIEPSGAITSTALANVTFAGSVEIQCRMTLRGSLERTVTLTAGQRLGSITAIEAGACNNAATVTILRLPYTLEYTSVEGTLPSAVTAVNFNVLTASFKLRVFGGFAECLYEGSQGAELAVTGTNPYNSGLISIIPSALRKISGSGSCPATGEMRGTLDLRPAQRISVR